MITQIFNFLLLLSYGILLVFAVGTWLHFSMKKANKQSREEALKVQSNEAGKSEDI